MTQFYTGTNILIISLKTREIVHIGLLHENYPLQDHIIPPMNSIIFRRKKKNRSLNKYNLPLSSLMQSSLISDSGIMRPLKKKQQQKNINLHHTH